MSRQDQTAETNALAIQGGRDVTVNLGPTGEEFGRLIMAVGTQLAQFHAEGQVKVEQRLNEFKAEVLKQFAEGTRAEPEALKDPDFQAVLGEAQKHYVRSDDPDVAASLINLIAVRSQLADRSRISLSLNAAVDVMGALTGEEIACLSAIFHTYRAVAASSEPVVIYGYLGAHLAPFTPLVPRTTGSLEYLASKGCVTISQFADSSFGNTVYQAYACAFMEPFKLEELAAVVPDASEQALQPLLAPVASTSVQIFNFDNSSHVTRERRFRFRYQALEQVRSAAVEVGLASRADAIHGFGSARRWPLSRVEDELFASHPHLRDFAEVWASTNMAQYNLTPVGLAIAHSNARRLFPTFQAPLSIWIN